jgi:Fur family transcriptional regulator, ferric uptake regulator
MTRPRNTRQRDALRRAFARADRPLSPHEALELARAEVPGLGIATVYRTVKALLEERWLRTVELPGAADRYEVAGKGHHHHFHCRACDGVFEVPSCPGGFRSMAPGGFHLERHEVVLFGVCRECSQ